MHVARARQIYEEGRKLDLKVQRSEGKPTCAVLHVTVTPVVRE